MPEHPSFPHHASDADLPAHEQSVLRENGLGTVCDLRGVTEDTAIASH